MPVRYCKGVMTSDNGNPFCSDAVAFIPARAGSKGLPGKNLAEVGGVPLFYRAVQAARDAGIQHVFVSTDIPEILTLEEPGLTVFRRPRELAACDITMGEVIHHFVRQYIPDERAIVLLQPTSPLRSGKHVRDALRLYRSGRYSMVMTIAGVDNGVLKCGTLSEGRFNPVSKPEHCFSNRQDLPEIYRPNGAVYVFPSKMFEANTEFQADNIGAVEMTELASVDVDTHEDLMKCEEIFQAQEV